MSEELTGGPGTTGFSKRTIRLNKLYSNLTPEQRANHPGFRRLYAVIQLEQELNDKVKKNMFGGAPQPGPVEPAVAPKDTGPYRSTTHDKADQETQLGVRRTLNDFIGKLGAGGAE